MVNTVPKDVTLTEPILPVVAKPNRLAIDINENKKMTVSGRVRVRDSILTIIPNISNILSAFRITGAKPKQNCHHLIQRSFWQAQLQRISS